MHRLLAKHAVELIEARSISYSEVKRILEKRTQDATEASVVHCRDNKPLRCCDGTNLGAHSLPYDRDYPGVW